SDRGIICFRHGHCPRISSDMDYFAVWKPLQQFGNMPNVDRKLYAGPLITTEFSNFLDKYSRNCSKGSIRLLDCARNFLLQFGVLGCFDALEPPEGSVETRDVLLRKTHVNHPINVFINR